MKTSITSSRLIAAPLILAGALLAACSAGVGSAGTVAPRSTPEGGSAASPTPSPSSPAETAEPTTPGATARATPASSGKISLKVYFLDYRGSDESPPVLVPANRQVDRTVAVASAALRQLIAGPTDEERAHNLATGTLGTEVPERTLLLGVAIQNGTATVDLSREFESSESGGDLQSMTQRFAQVVYTLTQFSTVDRVNFRLDGKPIKAINAKGAALDRPATRQDYVDILPAIFVDQPSWGGQRTDPVRVSGKANVFEAQFMAALVVWNAQGDRIVAQRSVMATCGTGCWGDFAFSLDVPSNVGRNADLHLRVWESSAMDGRPVNVLEYPLQ
jgi:spore germination protein GerM